MAKSSPPLDFELPIPNNYLIVIGLVIVQWGYFEGTMNEDILDLKKRPAGKAFRIGLKLPFAQRVKKWVELSRIVYGESARYETVRSLAQRAIQLKIQRDDIAHSLFSISDEGLNILVIRNGEAVRFNPISIDALRTLASEISRLNGDLLRYESQKPDLVE